MTGQNVCYRKVFSDLMLLSKDSKEYNVKKKNEWNTQISMGKNIMLKHK